MAMFECNLNSNLVKEQTILSMTHISDDPPNHVYKWKIANGSKCNHIIFLCDSGTWERMSVLDKINNSWVSRNIMYDKSTNTKYVTDTTQDETIVTTSGNDLLYQNRGLSSAWKILDCIGY